MIPTQITGCQRSGGDWIGYESASLVASEALPAGVTVGAWVDLGAASALRCTLACTAKSGTNPTLDVTVQTSPFADGSCARTAGTFTQRTGAAAWTMSAVSSAGTSPPVLTLTGTQRRAVTLSVEALVAGARGTWSGRYSIDGGASWTAFTSAATVNLCDAFGVFSGVVLNIAAGSASVDNTWSATTTAYEGIAMSAVASAGTTPPTVALGGVARVPVPVRVECTGAGARGVWTGRVSVDGGVTWAAFTSAASVNVLDSSGNDTGIDLTISAGDAATDNVWTASCTSYERKTFNGLDRYARVVSLVGGSATPTVTASVAAEIIF